MNEREEQGGRYVLYWMQQSQRAAWNPALEWAIERGNELGLPVVVYFGITDGYPGANLRHYAFMLEGLRETQAALAGQGVQMIVRHESPEAGVLEPAGEAALVVTDRGYTRIQKAWRAESAKKLACPLVQVEGDVVVPVEQVSGKEEYAAATIRKKIHRQLGRYLTPLKESRIRKDSLGLRFDGFDIDDVEQALERLDIDRSVGPVEGFRGGFSEAKQHLKRFIKERLEGYHVRRNDPTEEGTSNLSAYLHFGQISPVFVALEVYKAGQGLALFTKKDAPEVEVGTEKPYFCEHEGVEAFLEEMIVRRELAMNFVHYNSAYDNMKCLPNWVQETLRDHADDKREYVYSRDQWEGAETHDPYWNAAQREMMLTGKMHGYMRMYWGKKIIEWSRTHKEAYETAVYLNDKYELDGRDPNGYAGVGWCFGKHDRPWTERAVFGKVRYMNAGGLKRKFDVEGYVEKVDGLRR